MRARRGLTALALVAALGSVAAGCGRDDDKGGGESVPGVTDDSIKLGTTFPLSGPASAYATISRIRGTSRRQPSSAVTPGGRTPDHSDTQSDQRDEQAGGITNRPLDEEIANQREVPPRGEVKVPGRDHA